MIYPIVAYGHPVLKKKAVEIKKGEFDLVQLAEDMFETMHNAQGIGLAAPQINKSIRMFIADGSPLDDEEMKDFKEVFVNPVIIEEFGDDWAFEEGCLSIPNIREDVIRLDTLRIRYFDENWNEHDKEFDGMKARIIQHEFDHIEGVLFTDHLSAFKKRILKSKLTNISKGSVSVDYRMLFPARK
jgi:peptide deformylase